MKRVVLIYGSLSGAIIGLMLVISGLLFDKAEGFMQYGMVIGYASMLLAGTLIFFGIRTYRQQHDGFVSFGRAFGIGALIVLVAGIIYTIAWAFVYHFMMPDFMDKFAAIEVLKLKEHGATAAEIAKKTAEMDNFKEMYKNPVLFSLLTFMEPLPMGLIITLVSALILKRKKVNVEQTAQTQPL